MNIIIHFSDSGGSNEKIKHKAAEVHAKLIVESINSMPITKKQKEELLQMVIGEIANKNGEENNR